MPNHVHGIVWLNPADGGIAPTLGKVIGYFKFEAAKACAISCGAQRLQLWQRGYHDHIIRNEKDLLRIREYIRWNPLNWERDTENPAKGG